MNERGRNTIDSGGTHARAELTPNKRKIRIIDPE
jgi:hypothetical protein